MSGDFISIAIKEVRKETEEAVSILFEYPAEQREKLHFKPGQYVTDQVDGRDKRAAQVLLHQLRTG